MRDLIHYTFLSGRIDRFLKARWRFLYKLPVCNVNIVSIVKAKTQDLIPALISFKEGRSTY